ncbi:hypothetical protein TSOC_013731, partial [Tetrabaena socialis]
MAPPPAHPIYRFIGKKGLDADGQQLWRGSVRGAGSDGVVRTFSAGETPDPRRAALQADALLVCLHGNKKPLNLPEEMSPERRAELEDMEVDDLLVELRSGLIFARGSSAYRGVSFARRGNSWSAEIRIDGKKKNLGFFAHTYDGELEAACAYDDAATAYRPEGERYLNFPEGKPPLPAVSTRRTGHGSAQQPAHKRNEKEAPS